MNETPEPHKQAEIKDTKSKKQSGHFLKQRTNLSFLQMGMFAVIFAAVCGYIIWRTFAAAPPAVTYSKPHTIKNTQLMAKSQTMQLVGIAKRLQKDPNNANLINQARDVAAARSATVKDLINADPTEAVQIHFPADLITTLPAAAQAAIEREVTLQGKLDVLHGEQFDLKDNTPSNPFYNYSLTDAAGKKNDLHFKGEGPSGQGGNIVSVKGVQLEGTTAVGSTTDVTTLQTTTVASPVVRKVGVLLFNFADNTNMPYTPAQVQTAVFGTSGSTINNYYKEDSFGQLSLSGKVSLAGDVYGYYHLSDLVSAGCNYGGWSTDASNAAKAAGVDLTGYDTIMYMFPYVSACNWGGMGSMPGSQVWINGNMTSVYTVGHELGHNLGAHHANLDYCLDTAGAPTTLSTNCTSQEYRDYYDIMGENKPFHHNAYHLGEIGFLQASNTQTVTASGTYTVNSIETSSSGPISLRIPFSYDSTGTPNNFYYIEARKSTSFDTFTITDQNADQGVLVHIAPDYGTRIQSMLLDFNPSTSMNTDDATLVAGKTFTDAAHNISITTSAVSATGATVQVNIGGSTPTCTHAIPTITGSPTSQWANPGQTLPYTLTVKNNDSSACAASSFSLTSSVAAGLSQSPASSSVSLSPGASANVAINVTSSATIISGYYNFIETATNTTAGYSASTTLSYNVNPTGDTTPPTVTLSSPANGATVSGTTFINSSAVDNVSVAHIDLYIDGGLYLSLPGSTLSYGWLTPNFSNGSHTIVVKAYDAAGNVGSSATITVTVNNSTDTLSPAVSVTYPANGATVSGSLNVLASASDNVGVTKTELYIDGSLKTSVSGNSLSYNWSTSGVLNGSHTLLAKAYDAAGNVGTSSTISVTVNNSSADTTPPTVSISSPANGATVSRKVTISASAADNVSVSQIQVYIDNTLLTSSFGSSINTSWNTRPYSSGPHTITVKALDTSSNIGQSSITVYR